MKATIELRLNTMMENKEEFNLLYCHTSVKSKHDWNIAAKTLDAAQLILVMIFMD